MADKNFITLIIDSNDMFLDLTLRHLGNDETLDKIRFIIESREEDYLKLKETLSESIVSFLNILREKISNGNFKEIEEITSKLKEN